MLRFLLPLSLLLLILPVVTHWPVFARYGARWTKEVPALLLCVAVYFIVWAIVDAVARGATGSSAAGLVLASVVALAALPGALWLGYRLFGVPAHAHGAGGGVH